MGRTWQVICGRHGEHAICLTFHVKQPHRVWFDRRLRLPDTKACRLTRRLRLPDTKNRPFMRLGPSIAVVSHLKQRCWEMTGETRDAKAQVRALRSGEAPRALSFANRNRRSKSQKWAIFGIRQPQPAAQVASVVGVGSKSRTMFQKHVRFDAVLAGWSHLTKRGIYWVLTGKISKFTNTFCPLTTTMPDDFGRIHCLKQSQKNRPEQITALACVFRGGRGGI